MDRRSDPRVAPSTADRRLVLNPTSGRETHANEARELAAEHGFSVVETERAGHAIELAERAAADGVELLAVCGGDGTLHEVLRGLAAADALDSVTVCVVPAGTENIAAAALGIEDMSHGFELAERGETRRIDLGVAGDEPFVMSTIAGFPAEASAAATHDLKRRFGEFAFLVAGVREAATFDGLRVEVDTVAGDREVAWAGEALSVLIGNLRHFPAGGQADVEDGLLDVAIVEEMPAVEAVEEAIEQRLLHRETSHVRTCRTPRLDVASLDGEPVTFSFDGEIRDAERLQFSVRPRALRIRVGDGYEPDPDGK